MIDDLIPGETGTSLPDEEQVFRLIKGSMDGKASEADFSLSTSDKLASLRSVSVWSKKLTSPLQAIEFRGDGKNLYQLYSLLNVSEVRQLSFPGLDMQPLDVVWDKLFIDGSNILDNRPGAEGHSGITGLEKPPMMERRIFKALRTRLTDLANERLERIYKETESI